MPPTTTTAFTAARTISCAAVNTSMVGETAEMRLPTHSAATDQSRTTRRPRRSASAVASNAKSTPARVTARETPRVELETPKLLAMGSTFCPKSAEPKPARVAARATDAIRPACFGVNEAGGRNRDRRTGRGGAAPVAAAATVSAA